MSYLSSLPSFLFSLPLFSPPLISSIPLCFLLPWPHSFLSSIPLLFLPSVYFLAFFYFYPYLSLFSCDLGFKPYFHILSFLSFLPSFFPCPHSSLSSIFCPSFLSFFSMKASMGYFLPVLAVAC